MEPSWFVTPACCGGLFLHPAIVKVIEVMAPVIRSAASNLGEEKRIGFSTWFCCRLYGLLDHSERKDACPSPEGSKESVDRKGKGGQVSSKVADISEGLCGDVRLRGHIESCSRSATLDR
jgi:hypothetical protein